MTGNITSLHCEDSGAAKVATTVVNLVGSQRRNDKAPQDNGIEEGGVVKVVFVCPESLRNGQLKGGVDKWKVRGRLGGQ